jgi:AcrR family transcriptional regulator
MTPSTTAPQKSPKWRRRPEHRPQQIIEAALEVFGEYGLARTRLQDIANRAGVSKGTIYLYFPNKEELFREMIRQTAVAAIETGEAAITKGTPTEQLCAAMREYWKFVRTPVFSTIYRLVMGELHQFPDLARFYADEVVARALGMLTGIIRRGIDSGEFREIDPTVAARMLMALTVMNAIWRDEHTGVPLLCHKKDEEVFQELAHFYLHSLTTPAVVRSQADGGDADVIASLIPFTND